MAVPARLKLQRVSRKLLNDMLALCDSIESALESGDDASTLLEKWHSHARRKCQPREFMTYWKSISKETFVRGALNPPPSLDPDATYSEVSSVLDVVMNATCSESECNYYLSWLEEQFPDSNMNDLIYWPDEWFGDASLFKDASGAFKTDAELSNDQILGYAMAKSGRQLAGAPLGVILRFPIPSRK